MLESPYDCKEVQPVHPKGDQPWVFIGRTDAEAETPILWPPHAKSWLIRKDPDAGRDWRQEEKGMTEDEMTGWHHRLDGHEFEQTSGVGNEQGSLGCCNPWGHEDWHDWVIELKLTENIDVTGYIMVENVDGILLQVFWEELPFTFLIICFFFCFFF